MSLQCLLKKRNDGDDNVNIDVVQGRSEVESEEKIR